MKRKIFFVFPVFVIFAFIFSACSSSSGQGQDTKDPGLSADTENEKTPPGYQLNDFRFSEVTMEDDNSGATCKMEIDAPNVVNSTVLIDSKAITGESWTGLTEEQRAEKFQSFKNFIASLENTPPDRFSLEVMDKKITRLSYTDASGKEKIIFTL